jgi:hypothetical protein
MPNHITNKLKVAGTADQVKEVFEFIKNDEFGIGSIDFNKITPMPKWVFGNSPNVLGITLQDEKQWGEDNTSLGWARRHWGTKWNAYAQQGQRNSNDTIYFDTAWSGVPDLIRKIAWIFPEVEIEYSFADEDLGSSNCGIYRFKHSEIKENQEYESGTKEAYELAFELCREGEVPDYYTFNSEANTYEYVEGY